MDKKNTDISNEKESLFCIEKAKKYKKRIKVMKIMDIVVMIGIIILIIIILLLRGCVGDNIINGTDMYNKTIKNALNVLKPNLLIIYTKIITNAITKESEIIIFLFKLVKLLKTTKTRYNEI